MKETAPTINSALETRLEASKCAERAILGSLLLSSELWPEVAAELDPLDFSLTDHQQIFSAMGCCIERGKPIELISLTDQLGKELEKVGGLPYIASLTDGMFRRSSVSHYIGMVKDASKARQVVTACNRTLESYGDCSGDELSESLRSDLEAIEARSLSDSDSTPEEDVMETRARMREEARLSPDAILGASLALPEIDMACAGGVRIHEMLLLGGIPERGKTAFALQMGRANAERGNRVDVISCEMSKDALQRRNLATMAGIHPAKTRDPRLLTPEDELALDDAAVALSQMPLKIHEPKSFTPAKLLAKMRLLVHQHQKRLKAEGRIHILILDHLKAFSFRCPGSDERHRMNYAIESLRQFKMDEECVLVVIHHLKRHEDINHLPTMQDFKESGDIEAAADLMLALHREEQNSEFTGNDLAIFVKMRNGEKGPVEVRFDKRRLEYSARGTR